MGKETLETRGNRKEPAAQRDGRGPAEVPSRGRSWWARLRVVLSGVVLAGITGVVMVQPLLPTGRVALEEGEVAPETIRAPYSLTYDSAIRQEEEREKAVAGVEPVYTSPDPALARQQLVRAREVLDYLGSVRADTLASAPRRRAWVLAVPELSSLAPQTIDSLLALSDESWDRVQFETRKVIDQAMREEIREGKVADAKARVPRMISLDLSDEEADIATALARGFLVPNSFLNPTATAEAQARAREKVGPVARRFEAEQVIVREGDRVKTLDIEALDQFGLRQPQTKWTDFIGAAVLAALEVSVFYLYLARFRPDVLWTGQQLLLLLLLTAFFVVGTGLMVPGTSVLRYLAPAPALAVVVTAVLGRHAGAAAAVFLSIPIAVIADNSLEMIVYAGMGGLIAALVLDRVERIGEMFRAGAFVALVHVGVLVVFHLPQDLAQPSVLAASALAGVVNGGLSASLALGLLFLIGPVFDIVTTMRLIELNRPEHPLLQRLLREAPASYHHSLMVANLAEQAAERIGANALLTRVGAYYHDIGKIARPYFFTENQAGGVNPHDRLDPQTSAEVIVGHVTDGLELARRYHLPSRVRAFIPEHHGSSQVSFLYDRAVQLAGDAELVDEKEFRYPGRKPQSKETALVMLADACEAAVRSAAPNSGDEVAEIVNRIIDRSVEDGQLSECDLTLHDLGIIRQVFTSALEGAFHPRIQYPESEEPEKLEQESEAVPSEIKASSG